MSNLFGNQRPTRNDTGLSLSWGIWAIVIAAVLVTAIVVVSVAAGWITLPFLKGSAGNVEKQFTFGYQQYNALKATATSVCAAQRAVEAATNDSEKSQRTSQLLAYETNYARLAGEYDAWASNIFQGNVVRPADLPLRAPTLDAMKSQVCGQ